ncbi:MAG: DUF3488 and transglutaminase-like domain-containing protein [Myxococcota bacterium]
MSFARLHKTISYLIAGLGLYALSLGGELPTLSLTVVALGYVVSMFLEEPLLSRRGYIRGWNIAVVAVFAIQVGRGTLGEPFLMLGLEFAAFLQISRLCNRRSARDHQQIAVLAFLHLIAATILSTDIGYALVFLGFVIVTPWMLALSHLRREIEGNYPGVVPRSGPDVRRVLASRRVVGPSFLAGTAFLTVPIFAITVLLFLLFPRVGLGFLSFGIGSGQHTAGFGSNVELGGFGTIRDNPTVVLRARPPNLSAEPPEYLNLRFRGTSFDRYDGRLWTRSLMGGEAIRNMGDFYPIVRWADENRDQEMQIILDHLDQTVVFLPDNAIGITIPSRIRQGADQTRELRIAEGLDVRYIDDDDLGLTYVAHIATGEQELGVEELTPDSRERYLQLPETTDRLRALADELTADHDDDRSRADSILHHLQQSGTYTYSLTMPDTAGRDPLEVFLFDARSGHCEYFSTAMAIMLRTQGIPARNVTGFVGGRYNPYGEYYAIAQGDAHSWVEAYVDGAWVTYDPTPPARGNPPASSILDDLRAIVDALRSRWAEHVVSYDMRKQISGLRKVYRWFRQFRSEAEEAPREVLEDDGAPVTEDSPLPLVLIVVVVVVAIAVALRLRRKSTTKEDANLVRAAALYRSLDKALAKQGFVRAPSTTPWEHATVVKAAGFSEAPAVEEMVRRYQAVRFGGEELTAAEVAQWKGLIRQVQKALPPT